MTKRQAVSLPTACLQKLLDEGTGSVFIPDEQSITSTKLLLVEDAHEGRVLEAKTTGVVRDDVLLITDGHVDEWLIASGWQNGGKLIAYFERILRQHGLYRYAPITILHLKDVKLPSGPVRRDSLDFIGPARPQKAAENQIEPTPE